jgi:hypothetical protein
MNTSSLTISLLYKDNRIESKEWKELLVDYVFYDIISLEKKASIEYE